MTNKANDFKLKWIPQKRQLRFLKACGLDYLFPAYVDQVKGDLVLMKRKDKPDKLRPPEAKVIGYGGAAGGGKTDSLLIAMFAAMVATPGVNCAYFRRTFKQLEGAGGAIMRSQELFSHFPGASYNKNEHRWTFTTLDNAVLEFKHIQREDDLNNYQSQQFDYIAFDEATQFTRRMYIYLASRNRSSRKGVYPLMMLATNPGGVGHMWFRDQFVKIGPPEEPQDYTEPESGQKRKHIFIPAKLDDNMILEERDPGYRENLEFQGEIDRKRLLHGDWDIYEGQFFGEYDQEVHEMKSFDIPDGWKRYISVDYGLDMAAVYWYAIDNMGFIFVYREMQIPDLALHQLAEKILERTPVFERRNIAGSLLPPDLWNRRQETGKSGRQILVENGLSGFAIRKADNRRVEGWRVVKEYLKKIPDPFEENSLTARLKIFSDKCPKLCSHLPMLQRDEHNPDDVANDPHRITHGPDSLRYFLMSRPPLRSLTKREKKIIKENRERKLQPVSEVTGY